MIESAIEKNGWVYVYGNGNKVLFSHLGELVGYTSTSVSIKKGTWVYVYDGSGRQTASHYVG